MADVAGFDVAEIVWDEIDYQNYDTGGGGSAKSYGPPPAGKYFGVVGPISFGKTAAGHVSVFPGEKTESGKQAIVKVKVQGQDDYEMRIFPLSSKKYSNRQGSQAIDFLRACGIDAQPKSADEFVALCKMASGRTFQFGLDWEGFFSKDEPEHNKKSMKEFAKDEQDPSKHQPWYPHPYEEGKRIWARARIAYFVDAVKK